MYKKVCCKCKIVVLIVKTCYFLTFAPPSPSSDHKVPNNIGLGEG